MNVGHRVLLINTDGSNEQVLIDAQIYGSVRILGTAQDFVVAHNPNKQSLIVANVKTKEVKEHVINGWPFSVEVFNKLFQDELVSKVMRLPIKYREIIVLHYFEGLNSRETAELLEQNDSTVRTSISRGLSNLKEEMRDESMQNLEKIMNE